MMNTEGVYAKTHRRLALIMKTLIDKPCSFREVMLWEIHISSVVSITICSAWSSASGNAFCISSGSSCVKRYSDTPMGFAISFNANSATVLFLFRHSIRPVEGLSISVFSFSSTRPVFPFRPPILQTSSAKFSCRYYHFLTVQVRFHSNPARNIFN